MNYMCNLTDIFIISLKEIAVIWRWLMKEFEDLAKAIWRASDNQVPFFGAVSLTVVQRPLLSQLSTSAHCKTSDWPLNPYQL